MTATTALYIPEIKFDDRGELDIVPSASSSKNDFDFFFEGKWQLRNKKLASRLGGSTTWIEFDATQEMYRVLHGLGNIDNFLATFDGVPFERAHTTAV